MSTRSRGRRAAYAREATTATIAKGSRLAMSGGSARFVDQSERSVTMATGTVKWFNATKGFGFIQPDAGGPDVFVHISAVERAGIQNLNEGQKIAYEVVADRRTGNPQRTI